MPVRHGPVALLWAWMRGPDGLAAVQWIAAVFSLLAIAISLYVFLDQRDRAAKEELRELARERQAIERLEQQTDRDRRRLRSAVLQALKCARDLLLSDLPEPSAEMQAVDWLIDRGRPLNLRAWQGTLEALRTSAAADPALVLALRKASSVLQGAIDPSGWRGSPLGVAVRTAMMRYAAELDVVIDQVRRSSA